MASESCVIRVVPAAGMRGVVERRGEVIEVAHPLVAFAMLLELERRRRSGRPVPEVRVECPAGIDERFEHAVERHLPWVSIVRGGADARRDGESAARAAPAPSLVSADEIAMLFGAIEAGTKREGEVA